MRDSKAEKVFPFFLLNLMVLALGGLARIKLVAKITTSAKRKCLLHLIPRKNVQRISFRDKCDAVGGSTREGGTSEEILL